MRNVAHARVFALLTTVACLTAGPVLAQVGPIQPVLVLDAGRSEAPHNRPDFPETYAIPVDVYVAADGAVTHVVVTETSKNEVADQLAADLMRQKKFLPALDSKGRPVSGMAKVTVSMFKRGNKKVAKVIVKPPAINSETDRVKRMMCADFIWEVERLEKQADVRDTAYEVMPYMTARMYLEQKHVPSASEEKFWDSWPKALNKVIDRCQKDELKFFYAEVLVPALDGVMPAVDSAVASTEN